MKFSGTVVGTPSTFGTPPLGECPDAERVRSFRVHVLDDHGRVHAPALDLEHESIEEFVAKVTPLADGQAFEVWEGRELVLRVDAAWKIGRPVDRKRSR
jgi:hypothetical protein